MECLSITLLSSSDGGQISTELTIGSIGSPAIRGAPDGVSPATFKFYAVLTNAGSKPIPLTLCRNELFLYTIMRLYLAHLFYYLNWLRQCSCCYHAFSSSY
jgi:hypothetical protein